MNKLKFIDLSYSLNLNETPDFSGVPNVEYLRLHSCESLVKIHNSLEKLKALVEVDLSDCVSLEILPKKLETNSLLKLNLRKCQNVVELPEFGEGMKKLSILDVSETSIIRLPESFGSLIGLRRLTLSDRKNFNLEELGKSHISRQVFGLNVRSLTELGLRKCDLNDGLIPDDFGSLSPSLVVLDLSGNNFVNLPNDCFSSLDGLAILSLVGCVNLKSLPRLPPRLIRLEASGCDSMEPLAYVQLWNLVASFDHEYRGRTKFVMFEEENDDIPLIYEPMLIEAAERLLRDFCAVIPARSKEIPSWFGPNKKDYDVDEDRREFEIQVDIPQHFHSNEWSGIVVCFLIVKWSSKVAEEYDYMFNDWAHSFGLAYDEGSVEWSSDIGVEWRTNKGCHMCMMMVLELNEETCWRHLRRSHHNSLHTLLSIFRGRILGSGWRVICKEEIKEYFNRPLLPSPHHHITPLSSEMLARLIRGNW